MEPLPGFKPMKAMVYAGVFPMDTQDFGRLEEAIQRLTLNDRSGACTVVVWRWFSTNGSYCR